MKKVMLLIGCTALTCCFTNLQAQGLLKKMKDKAANIAEQVADKKVDDAVNKSIGAGNTSGSGTTSTGSTTSSKGNPTNKGGAGLVTTPPDVAANLGSAETAFKSGSYGEARYAVQQAMLGVEMEIGQTILQSLPESVAGLKKEASADQVTSTGWGWAGLTIHREYTEGDKQLRFTIANNALWMQAVNLYLANGGYSQTTGGQQNWKQTKLKGYRAVIEYDEGSGYKLSVPLGQTSLLVFEGVNFANEKEMMSAAETFDLESIKNRLGEK